MSGGLRFQKCQVDTCSCPTPGLQHMSPSTPAHNWHSTFWIQLDHILVISISANTCHLILFFSFINRCWCQGKKSYLNKMQQQCRSHLAKCVLKSGNATRRRWFRWQRYVTVSMGILMIWVVLLTQGFNNMNIINNRSWTMWEQEQPGQRKHHKYHHLMWTWNIAWLYQLYHELNAICWQTFSTIHYSVINIVSPVCMSYDFNEYVLGLDGREILSVYQLS